MDYQTIEIICLNNGKTFSRILTVYLFVKKKRAKEIQNSAAVYQAKEIICSMDCKSFFEDINSYHFALKSTKELENSSAHSDYPTKEIICSIGCKTF